MPVYTRDDVLEVLGMTAAFGCWTNAFTIAAQLRENNGLALYVNNTPVVGGERPPKELKDVAAIYLAAHTLFRWLDVVLADLHEEGLIEVQKEIVHKVERPVWFYLSPKGFDLLLSRKNSSSVPAQ